MEERNVKTVVAKVVALRRLTVETGTVTRRAQSKLLQMLTDEELSVAAEMLAVALDEEAVPNG